MLSVCKFPEILKRYSKGQVCLERYGESLTFDSGRGCNGTNFDIVAGGKGESVTGYR